MKYNFYTNLQLPMKVFPRLNEYIFQNNMFCIWGFFIKYYSYLSCNITQYFPLFSIFKTNYKLYVISQPLYFYYTKSVIYFLAIVNVKIILSGTFACYLFYRYVFVIIFYQIYSLIYILLNGNCAVTYCGSLECTGKDGD